MSKRYTMTIKIYRGIWYVENNKVDEQITVNSNSARYLAQKKNEFIGRDISRRRRAVVNIIDNVTGEYQDFHTGQWGIFLYGTGRYKNETDDSDDQ